MNAASSVSVGKNHFWGVEYNKMSFSNRLKKIQCFTSQNLRNGALHLSTLLLISPLKRNIFPADPDEAALFFANNMYETAKKCQPLNFRTMAPLCPLLLLA